MPPVAGKPVNCRNESRIMLAHRCFVVKNGVTGPDWDTTERRDRFAIELLDTEEHVGFIHRLKVEVGTDDTVAVDDRAAHIGSNLRGVGGLDRGSGDWCGG